MICSAQGCTSDAINVCICPRCRVEEDSHERFYTCQEHYAAVEHSHVRVRDRSAIWGLRIFSNALSRALADVPAVKEALNATRLVAGNGISSSGDMVNHPVHYGGADNPYEAIKVIDAWQLGFALGNTVKYVARAAHKGTELEDLKKAAWYLNHRIEELEALHNIQLANPQITWEGRDKP